MKNYYIGLMSGTSMDGIDAALVDVESHQLVKGCTTPYPPDLAKRLTTAIAVTNTTIENLCHLNHWVGCAFAQAANSLIETAGISAESVIAIGSHGQTLCHHPENPIPYTYQVGCAHTIAAQTGITVVADFRTRDLLYNGQGAPLAPLYHQVLFQRNNEPVAVVNLGGIANVTFLKPNMPPVGFDTGPANCLLDAWALHQTNQPFDKNGRWAASGQVNQALLSRCLEDPFFARPYPKSIDKGYFSLAWLAKHLPKDFKPQDIQATLSMLVVASIKALIEAELPKGASILLCGGGVHNQHLIKLFQENLLSYEVSSTEEFGVHPDFIEAMMMAWLAKKTIHQEKLNLQAVTGSTKPYILGAVYYV